MLLNKCVVYDKKKPWTTFKIMTNFIAFKSTCLIFNIDFLIVWCCFIMRCN